MRALARSLRHTGEAIPVPWASLARVIHPRPGNLVVAQADPGVGKSLFGLAWAHGLERPALMVSLDTDLFDQALRTASLMTGRPVSEISRDRSAWAEWLEDQALPLRFFEDRIPVYKIGELVEAEAELWGEPPTLVVVDDTYHLLEGEESASEYKRIFLDLYMMARKYGCVVLALHHLKRRQMSTSMCRKCGEPPPEPGSLPVTLRDGLYGGEQLAQLTLGLWRPRPNVMAVSVLKQRMGPAAADGSYNVRLELDLAKSQLKERYGRAA